MTATMHFHVFLIMLFMCSVKMLPSKRNAIHYSILRSVYYRTEIDAYSTKWINIYRLQIYNNNDFSTQEIEQIIAFT